MSYANSMVTLLAGNTLSRTEAETIMGRVLDGELSATQTAALLTVLAANERSAEEMAGFATAMRARARSITVLGDPIDTCGTGGSGLHTLNTSTMVALVAAAGGAKVVKHGNRASSGKCGSMDVLERLGINVALSPDRAEEIAKDGEFVFLNARVHHPALGPLAPIRKELGFRTVFNFLGPLCNPAGVRRQLLGVSDSAHARTLAFTLAELGVDRALVVSGDGGLDELALHGPTLLFDVHGDGTVKELHVIPEDAGLERASMEELDGGDLACNATWCTTLLEGRDDGPRARHLALNAGAAFWVAGLAPDLPSGVRRAQEVIASGAAMQTLERYRARTNGHSS